MQLTLACVLEFSFFLFSFLKKLILACVLDFSFFLKKTQTKSPLQPTMCMLRTKWTLLSYLYTCKLLSWCMWHFPQSDMLHVHVKDPAMPSKKMSGALWRSPQDGAVVLSSKLSTKILIFISQTLNRKFWFLYPKLSTKNSDFYLESSQPKILIMHAFSPFLKKIVATPGKKKSNSYFSK